jgi:hypothetical protein
MSSPDQLSPIKPNSPNDSRTIPNQIPKPKEDPAKTANFKKLMRQGSSLSSDKDQQEGVSESNDAPSLFDLSSNSKPVRRNLSDDSSFTDSTPTNESSSQLRNKGSFRPNNTYTKSNPNNYVKSNNQDYSTSEDSSTLLTNEGYTTTSSKNFATNDKGYTNSYDANSTNTNSKKFANSNDKGYTNSNSNSNSNLYDENYSNINDKNYTANNNSINQYSSINNDEMIQEPLIPTDELLSNLPDGITPNNPGTETDKSFSTPNKLPTDPTLISQAKLQQADALELSKNPLVSDSIAENITSSNVKKQNKVKSQAQANNNEFQEHIDLTAITPRVQTLDFSNQNSYSLSQQEVPRSTTLKDIAAQIISRIQVLRQEGQVDTTVTLKNPPILEGAQLTITTNDHAQKEFNIKFSSLSPEAKVFLDRKLNEDSLTQTLESKGIIIHMLVTTTAIDNPLTIAKKDLYDPEKEQQQQNREQNQEQEPSEEEES